MVICAYCKKKSEKHIGLSFHHFPSKQEERDEWMKNMGLKNWTPSKYSALCADHFSRNCIDFRDERARLRKGSVPTIFENKQENCSSISVISEAINVDEDNENNLSTTSSIVPVENQHKTEQAVNKIDDYCYQVTLNQKIFGLRHDHTYELSREELKRKLEALEERNRELTKEVKNKRRKEKRAKRKIQSMKEVIEDLKHNKYMENYSILNSFGDIPSEIFKRMQDNALRNGISKDKYSPELRCFALTLHFYSPAAYKYVRDTFELALPHPSQLRLWYNSIDAEPGFSEECFTALALKRDENIKLICSLIMDEMGIKKGVQRTRDGKVYGHVNIGGGTTDTSSFIATEALVMGRN